MVFNVISQQYFSYIEVASAPTHALLGFFLTNTPRNIISKPLAAFPHNHCRNNGQQRERNESCRNDDHQSSETILAEPGDRTSDFLFSSPVRYRLSFVAWLVRKLENAGNHYFLPFQRSFQKAFSPGASKVVIYGIKIIIIYLLNAKKIYNLDAHHSLQYDLDPHIHRICHELIVEIKFYRRTLKKCY